MIEVVFTAVDFDALAQLSVGGLEQCAVLFAAPADAPGRVRLLVRRLEVAGPDDYIRQTADSAELAPSFVARVTKRAMLDKLNIIFAHSHPGDVDPVFSEIDDAGELRLAAFMEHRHPGHHGAILVTARGMRARRLGHAAACRIIKLGAYREVISQQMSDSTSHVFDRQVRAFGSAGQRALQALRVGIVGLGGTGSIVSEQLVHLGIHDFLLVDPDVVELTNLNRLSNATPRDVGIPKVDVAERYISAVRPDAMVKAVRGDITRFTTATRLTEVDVLFGCTDSHGSRAVLQQVSYQYLIPCIDMGTTIIATDGHISDIIGRAQLLAPGHACFTCSGLLDSAQVSRDMMSDFERNADPYIVGAREPAPAVMSLNGTVASIAVTMLLSIVAGVPAPARCVYYNAMASSLRSAWKSPTPNCFICSPRGALARGSTWPINARKE